MGKSRSKSRRFSLFPKKQVPEVETVTHKKDGDAHTIEVAHERLETSAMAVFPEPKADPTPLAPPVSSRTGEAPPSQNPITLPESTSRAQILHWWSVSRVERWAGSRWRLVATVLAVALMGLI